jgi:Protein of unknown function (DUF1501)
MGRVADNPTGRGSSRRAALRAAGLGLLGPWLANRLADAARAKVVAPRSGKPIRACILVFYYGGPSHLDTWDMKPNAPREVRGIFRPVATKVPGLWLGEHLPECARIADRLTIIRSLHHPMTNHNAAAFATLCGRNPVKGDQELLADDRNDPPCLGSSLALQLAGGVAGDRGGIPAFVALPHVMHNVVLLPGQRAGFLGSAFDPVQVVGDPSSADFRLDELELPADVTPARLGRREALLKNVEEGAGSRYAGPLDAYHARAVGLYESEAVRQAFDLTREDPRVRDRYGRNRHGQAVLLARRLVETGVRCVAVYDRMVNGQNENWDAHADVFNRLKDHLLPPADQALAALVTDLEARGQLDETLIVALGEFGRTPRINPAAGRDHWPYCFSAVLAGGGVHGGAVFGSSDKLGAYPDADAVTPSDLAATLFWRFGLDANAEIRDLTGRPYRLADGQPLRTLFA